jgi:glycosyltransferase involved in cell wall biosynthesis
MGSLSGQTLRDFEVIVVDDGPREVSGSLLADLLSEGSLDLRVVTLLRGASGPSAARNAGWRLARAPLVAFTDDDCEADPGWLAALVAAAGSGSTDVIVQGRTAPIARERPLLGPFSRSLWIDSLGPWFQACNVLYPRALLEAVGGFDQESFPFVGEDADLAWRARARGAAPVWAGDARVGHAVARLGPLGALRFAGRWSDSVQLFGRDRGPLVKGLFWKGSHYLLVRALVGLALPRRLRRVAAWLWAPYVAHLLERGRVEGGGPLLMPWFVLHDLVEIGAIVRGAVRYRVFVL